MTDDRESLGPRASLIGLAAGLAVAASVAAASRGPTLVPWPTPVRRAFPLVLGSIAGIGVGLTVGTGAAAARLATRQGGHPSTRALITAGAIASGLAGGLAVAGRLGRTHLLARMEAESRGLDPAFADGPTEAEMSGSGTSLVPVLALGREGARFVSTAVSAADIESVAGQSPIARPIRVFVGVDAAPSVEARVELAMAELHRTGAFDRSHLLIQAPAGTGYANATPADVLEILTGGDCASVAVGYGLLPSFLSLGKVPAAALTQRLLIESIAAELAGRSHRPRVLLYGESLGAKVQQAAIPGGIADFDRFGIDAALWVGTPGSAEADAYASRCASSMIRVDRPEQVPWPLPSPRPRAWFLAHDGDPVVNFRPELIRHRPDWLPTDGRRGRNVPRELNWKPMVTWAQALVDTIFATNIKPGDFQSLGHDYRADLGALVRAAYDLPATTASASRLESALRTLEVARAERINAG